MRSVAGLKSLSLRQPPVAVAVVSLLSLLTFGLLAMFARHYPPSKTIAQNSSVSSVSGTSYILRIRSMITQDVPTASSTRIFTIT